MLQLNGRFQVEAADISQREGYLADHKVETYLIVPPAVSTKRHIVVSETGVDTPQRSAGSQELFEKSSAKSVRSGIE
jgi:hypothetical protein